jgi:formate--tetrahydrofolate ligase
MQPAETPRKPQPILDVARELGLAEEHVVPYGRDKAKVELAALERAPQGAGRLVLVSAINPTPAGEGKTTTSIALAMGMRRLGKRVALCLREPSLGPVFGVKGGGTGGGRATLVPASDINLHFTGDLHAISSAHNLLSAMVDNACHFGLSFGEKGALDPRLVTWGRCMDMNDRALRNVIVGLGRKVDGVPRQDRFDITAASEIMAILALASGPADLAARLGRVVVGTSASGTPITAEDVGASHAMVALLRDALKPNLVQTEEGGPAIVHAGPFANIAHGCSSVIATRLGLVTGDYVVTEAGFGLDLGGEKFLDIKCRALGAWPRAVVVVATLRALKVHGGASLKASGERDAAALERGLAHLDRHLATIGSLGLPAVVAINVFPADTEEELELVRAAASARGVPVGRSDGFARGGAGALELASTLIETVDATDRDPPKPRYVYELGDSLEDKVAKIATKVYGAQGAQWAPAAARERARLEGLGARDLPVCMAKTQLSLSDDPDRKGRPEGFTITVRELRLSAGAGFVVALTGDIMTMPGLPREPAALKVRLGDDGRIRGLMQNDD